MNQSTGLSESSRGSPAASTRLLQYLMRCAGAAVVSVAGLFLGGRGGGGGGNFIE